MRRAAWGRAVVALVTGCEQPRTELVVRVDSELAWGPGQRVQSVVLTVRREGAAGPLRSARTTALGAGGVRRPLPLLVGVTAGDDVETPVWIEALGCGDPNGCTAATAVVAQRAVVRFARGETQEVTLLLASACVGVRCASEQRCAVDSGRCEAATRAQEMVRPFSGTDAATVGGDAKVSDGSTDADTLTDSALDIGDDAVVADVSHDVAALKDAVVRDDASDLDAGVIDLPDVRGLADVPVWDEDLGGSADVGGPGDVGASPFDTSVVDTGSACVAPLTECAPGPCVNTQNAAAHCGMCNRACPAGETCNAGVCGLACPAGQTACTGRCVDLNTDANNCGACGRTCIGGQWCIAGACGGGPHYAVDPAPVVPYVDACGASGSQRVLTFADDSGTSVTLPFATRWWGAAIPSGASMYISSNGNVQVNTSAGSSSLSGTIPSTLSPNNLMAPQWRDLRLGSSGVCVATVGTAPSRRWVAQWVGAQYYSDSTSNLNFEVILHEGSGVVEFAYGAMSGSTSATVGMENPTGTEAVGPCPSGHSCPAVSNARARFTPVP